MAKRSARGGRRDAGHVGVDAYAADPMYPGIVRAVAAILATGKVVTPVEVLVRTGRLSPSDVEAWRGGRVPYLERVIRGTLTQLRRLLRILRFHVHDLNLVPSAGAYARAGRGPRTPLRFSKTGDPGLEAAYSTCFTWPGKGPFPRERAGGKLAARDAGAAGDSEEPPAAAPLRGTR